MSGMECSLQRTKQHSVLRSLDPFLSVALGPAWAGSSVNCKPYASEALIATSVPDGHPIVFGAFFGPDGDIVCYRWDSTTQHLSTKVLEGDRRPNDAHFTNSVQQDSAGRLHVTGGAHRNKAFHFASEPGGDISTLHDVTSLLPEEMSDGSYPSFMRMRDSGDLWLMYRLGLPHRSQWRAVKWDAGQVEWGRPHTLVSGISNNAAAGVYPNQPIALPGDRVGLVYCWRSQEVERGKRDPMNLGLDYVTFNEDLKCAKSQAGLQLSMPVTLSNSERIIPVLWGADLFNQAGATTLSSGMPCFVSAWRPPSSVKQIHFCWQDWEGIWQHREITQFREDHELRGGGTLPTLYSRPVVVPATKNRVIVIYRDNAQGGRLIAQPLSPPEYSPDAHDAVVLVPEGLNQYEPAVERSDSNILYAYVQSAQQLVGGDEMENHTTSPARLMAWEKEKFFV